jgi:hypothetical protein
VRWWWGVLAVAGCGALTAAVVPVTSLVAVRVIAGEHAVRAAAAPAGRDEGIDAALRLLSTGVSGRNQATYLSAFDTADAALAVRERRIHHNLLALPLATFEVTRDPDQAPQTPGVPADYPPDAVVVPVVLQWSLQGWDDTPVREPLPLTLAPTRRGWKIVGDSDLGGFDALGSWAGEPWSVSETFLTATAHALVIADTGHVNAAKRLASQLETLVPAVRAQWPGPSWNGKVVAYAVDDPAFVRAWFGASAASSGPAGTPQDRAGAEVEAEVATVGASSVRLIVTPYLLGKSDDDTLFVLRHELTHVATELVGRPLPRWLVEGAAEYSASRVGGARVNARASWRVYQGVGRLPAALTRTPLALPGDVDTFSSGSADAVALNYARGWLACLYVADRYGDAVLRRLYDQMAMFPEDEPLDVVQNAVLRQVLHQNTAQFTAAVRAYGVRLARQA